MVLATRQRKAVAKRARPKTLVVNFVLDETGSMGVCRDATISGFNEYVEELLKRKERILFTLTKFNSEKIEVTHAGVPVKDVSRLHQGNYVPAALTPLYDAIAKTVKATEEALKAKHGKPSVLCVIMTDGQENASRENTREAIYRLIKEKEAEGWTFVYLGANYDAWDVGQSIGLAQGNTMSYAGTPSGTQAGITIAATATADYLASGGKQTKDFWGVTP